jgi:hypothetical protein
MTLKTFAMAALCATGGAVLALSLADRPVIAQSFSPLPANGAIAATTPSANGVSHAWTVDSRTNRIVFCTGDSSGRISCADALMPGAARTP